MSEMSDADAHLHRYQDAHKRCYTWMRRVLVSAGTTTGACILLVMYTFMASVGQLNEAAYEVLVFVFSVVCVVGILCLVITLVVSLVCFWRVVKLRKQQPDEQN